jgi:hypothetical protein
MLLGCHIRQHRFQKLKMLIVRRQLRTFCAGLLSPADYEQQLRDAQRSDGPATLISIAA